MRCTLERILTVLLLAAGALLAIPAGAVAQQWPPAGLPPIQNPGYPPSYTHEITTRYVNGQLRVYPDPFYIRVYNSDVPQSQFSDPREFSSTIWGLADTILLKPGAGIQSQYEGDYIWWWFEPQQNPWELSNGASFGLEKWDADSSTGKARPTGISWIPAPGVNVGAYPPFGGGYAGLLYPWPVRRSFAAYPPRTYKYSVWITDPNGNILDQLDPTIVETESPVINPAIPPVRFCIEDLAGTEGATDTAARVQSDASEVTGDVLESQGGGWNTLATDEETIGLQPDDHIQSLSKAHPSGRYRYNWETERWELDQFSMFWLSVEDLTGSEGITNTAVRAESDQSQDPADLFVSGGTGGNWLYAEEVQLGLDADNDNLDGLEMDMETTSQPIYFSVEDTGPGQVEGRAGTAVRAQSSANEVGADIFVSTLDGSNQLYLDEQYLGLEADDQIDALVVFSSPGGGSFDAGYDSVFFSVKDRPGLSEGATGTAVRAQSDAGDVAGDVFVSSGSGNALFRDESALGLEDDDNLDGLDVASTETTIHRHGERIPPQGGDVESEDGNVRWSIPSGAFSSNVNANITSRSFAPSPPEGRRYVGEYVYSLDPSGAIYEPGHEATITFNYPDGCIPPFLAVYRYDTGTRTWERLSTAGVDHGRQTISVRTDHNSLYALTEDETGGPPTPIPSASQEALLVLGAGGAAILIWRGRARARKTPTSAR